MIGNNNACLVSLVVVCINFFIILFILPSLNAQNIWPLPQQITIDNEKFWLVDPSNFVLDTTDSIDCELLYSTFERYRKTRFFIRDCSNLHTGRNEEEENEEEKEEDVDVRPHDEENDGKFLNKIQFSFGGYAANYCPSLPTQDMDEGYYIEVNDNEAKISVSTVWGAMRAFETLSQLLTLDADSGSGRFRLPHANIVDWPRFTYRGIMIDTSRHYQPMSAILDMLDAMEMNKMNVLHWHMVDDQSFPYKSEKFPNLSQKGAFLPKTHVYTAADIRKVVEYARQRGIRVVPEFDSPGHTKSWGPGGPEGLLTACHDEKSGQPTGAYGPIDPTREENFQFLQELFQEVTDLFPDEYFHLGGDEVSISGIECWKTNPAVRQYMRDTGMGENYRRLEVTYMQRMLKVTRDQLKRNSIAWQEVFDNVPLDDYMDTIIHVWVAQRNGGWRRKISDVTRCNFRAILSAPWYLNEINEGEMWIGYYNIDPLDFGGNEEQNKLVLGGEACLWSEMIDGANLIPRTWPRASAVAERLWSSAGTRYSEAVRGRFHAQHCRMQRYGLRPGPGDGPGFCPCDHML